MVFPQIHSRNEQPRQRDDRRGLVWNGSRSRRAGSGVVQLGVHRQFLSGVARPPGGPERLELWQGQLNQGASYADIVTGIASSVEYRTHELTSLYQTYLGRSLDDGGRVYWLSLLNAGASWEQVEAGIAGSTEHFHYVGQTIQSDITNLFQNT